MASEKRELEILTRYRDRKITRVRAAELLGTSERQVNRRMEDLEFVRARGKRAELDEQAEKRRELRLAAARLVVANRLSHKQAALRAGCSARTIYRYAEKVESEHKKKK